MSGHKKWSEIKHKSDATDTTNPKDALGVQKAALRFVPPALTIFASDAFADGAAKYGAYNWRKTRVRLTVYLEAMQRHLLAMQDGQDCAEDSGHNHLAHVIACAGIILDAAAHGSLIDDREIPGPAALLLRNRDKTQPYSGATSDAGSELD